MVLFDFLFYTTQLATGKTQYSHGTTLNYLRLSVKNLVSSTHHGFPKRMNLLEKTSDRSFAFLMLSLQNLVLDLQILILFLRDLELFL